MAQTNDDIKLSSRQKFHERFVKRHPDIDVNDEEAYFGALNDENDENDKAAEELERFRNDDQTLKSVMGKDHRLGGIMMAAVNGENVLDYLIDKYGADFAEVINDPENDELRKKIADKQAEYLKKEAEAQKLEGEAQENLEATLAAFDKVADERGASDEEREAAFKRFVDFQADAIRDKVSEEAWRIFFDGIHHDEDVDNAAEDGEVRGRNAKIEMKLRKPTHGVPPELGGQGARHAPERQEKRLPGVLGDDFYMKSWSER